MFWLSLISAAYSSSCEDLIERLDVAMMHPSQCGTHAVFGLQEEARSLGLSACFEPVIRSYGLPVAGPKQVFAGGGEAEELSTRDMYYSVYTYETEHFAIHWDGYQGGGWSFNDADIEALGQSLENVWDFEIGELGFEAPSSTAIYRFNIYIGDTGNPSITAGGSGGYSTADGQGYPIIVLSRDTVADHAYGADISAHEFFHALQYQVDTFQYVGHGAWYWEATAKWVEGEVIEGPGLYADFLFGWAFVPQLPINEFNYYDGVDFDVTVYHQYGAALFPRNITENYVDRDIIRRSWLEAPYAGDPMVVLNELLQEDNLTLDEVYVDMAFRAGTYDFEDGETLESINDLWSDYYPEYHKGSTGKIDGYGEFKPPADLEPRTFGANYWDIIDLEPGTQFQFEGDEGPDWYVALVRQDGENHIRQMMTLEDGKGSFIAEDLSGDEVKLVVAAIDGVKDEGETWSYTITAQDPAEIVEEEPKPKTADPKQACGCATQSQTLPWAMISAGTAFLIRRRRLAR